MIKPKEIEKLKAKLGELRQILEKEYHLTGDNFLESGTPAYQKFFSDKRVDKKEGQFLDFYARLDDKDPDDAELKKVYEAYEDLMDRIDVVYSEDKSYDENDEEPSDEPEVEPSDLELAALEDDDFEAI